ncbi:hypothetical protein TEA_009905 [Camellia sinensis var. sinensis]|uniref:Uncharacterized protein n=1 Tax=Camellia sinensis var. sinensis TaxID=542762 RepID=A0A4V3WLV4_CAMSN|nr:hypothetical protein TEA_009905 [Camellia sinensis var. sinensis]
MQRKVAGSESSSSQNQTEDKPTALPTSVSFPAKLSLSLSLKIGIVNQFELKMSNCICCRPMISIKSIDDNNNNNNNNNSFVLPRRLSIGGQSIRDGRVLNSRVCGVRIRASMVDSYESSSNFVKRMEKAWIISQVPPCSPSFALPNSKHSFKVRSVDGSNNNFGGTYAKGNQDINRDNHITVMRSMFYYLRSKVYSDLNYQLLYLAVVILYFVWSPFVPSNISHVPDACSNQGPLLALLVTQMGMLNANGVVVQVSLFLVTTCFAKYHPETAVVLFVLGRQGSTCCADCKGTGFRAKWLGEPPISK